MFDFLKRKVIQNSYSPDEDFSFVGIDVHSHILPGIDDGAPDLEASLKLVRSMQDLGYHKLIATPHISSDFYPNNPAIISESLARLREQINLTEGLEVTVEAAAEYMIDDAFLLLLAQGGPFLPLVDTYLLFEMGFVQEDPRLLRVIFEIQAAGFKPILAHPERYPYYHNLPLHFFQDLKNKGCYLQLNTIALCGYYGKNVKVMAERLLQNGLYDFCGSDIHHQRHCNALSDVRSTAAYKTLKKSNILNAGLY